MKLHTKNQNPTMKRYMQCYATHLQDSKYTKHSPRMYNCTITTFFLSPSKSFENIKKTPSSHYL